MDSQPPVRCYQHNLRREATLVNLLGSYQHISVPWPRNPSITRIHGFHRRRNEDDRLRTTPTEPGIPSRGLVPSGQGSSCSTHRRQAAFPYSTSLADYICRKRKKKPQRQENNLYCVFSKHIENDALWVERPMRRRQMVGLAVGRVVQGDFIRPS